MSYWDSTLRGRISRRRLMGTSAGVGLGAALLAACGGGSDSGGNGANTASLAIKPVDTQKDGKPGGNWVFLPAAGIPSDPPSLDPLTTTLFGTDFHGHFIYSRAVKYKPGSIDSAQSGDVEGDAFSSWELSPDKLTLTFKLRDGMKFEPQAPVNGRAMTVDDVKWSWDRLAALHVARSSFVNSVSPSAPITSMTTPDAKTIVFKLAFPYVPILSLFAVSRGLVIEPVEAEAKFDPRKEMHGSGPWMLTNYQPSVSFEYKRNPNYYVANRPFIETISRPIIKEYAAMLSQFETGTIWQMNVRPEDVLPIKKRQPRMNLLSTGWDPTYSYAMSLDWKTTSPFRDARVRQAMSMMVDRDAWIESFENTAAYKAEGVDAPIRWHSHIGAGDDRYWLDPKSGKLGDASQYFKLDPANAKKLLQAAGKEGLAFPINFQAGSDDKNAQIMAGMLEQNGGMKPTLNSLDTATWNSTFHAGGGKADGASFLHPGNGADIDVWLDTRVRFGATQYVPYTEPLPIIDDLCKAQKQEFDEKKRTAMILDIEREMAKQMYSIPSGGGPLGTPGIAERHQLSWPWLSGFGYQQSFGGFTATEVYANLWYDESKKNA